MENNENLSLRKLLEEGRERLFRAGIEEASEDAWFLLEYVTGIDRTYFFLHEEERQDVTIVKKYRGLIEQRAERIPVSYLTQSREFMGFSFYVNEDVLIPEQDTEILVEEVLKMSAGKTVLDLCTGSGCIALSVALLGKPLKVIGSDISEGALAVAKKNLGDLRKNETKNIEFVKSDLFRDIRGEFDIIVSNPPYIRREVIESLAPEVKDYEPRLALCGGEDGLKFYRRIGREAGNFLKKDASLFLEIGFDQAEAVSAILSENGFEDITVIKDLAGFDRVVSARFNR